jgi:hypothetical protein
VRQLSKPETVDAVVAACSASQRIAEQWTAILEMLFARGPRRRRSADHGLLKAIVPSTLIPGLLGLRALALCVSMTHDELAGNGDGCLGSLCSVNLDPLLSIVTEQKRGHLAILHAATILAAATRFRQARRQLSSEANVIALCAVCAELPLPDTSTSTTPPLINLDHGGPAAESIASLTAHVLDLLANVLLIPETQSTLTAYGPELKQRLIRLTTHTSRDVRFHATRVCVYSNSTSVPPDCLFDVE